MSNEQNAQRPLVEGPAVEQFKQDAEKMAQHMRSQGLDPDTGRPVSDTARAAVEPNADALAAVQTAHRNRESYENDSAYRTRVEAAYAAVFSGKSTAEVQKILNGGTPTEQPQPHMDPAEPTGSPADRFAERLASGDVVEAHEPEFEKLSHGYKIADLLPAGFGLGANESDYLRAARYAGLGEKQVRTIVATMVRAQQ